MEKSAHNYVIKNERSEREREKGDENKKKNKRELQASILKSAKFGRQFRKIAECEFNQE